MGGREHAYNEDNGGDNRIGYKRRVTKDGNGQDKSGKHARKRDERRG